MSKNDRPRYESIAPVSVEQLGAAIQEPRSIQPWKALLDNERKYIEKWREKRGDPAPFGQAALKGLAISGGGIRSATFALGVMQAIAHEKKLQNFDCLSTVSGGGYIGSGLTWWLSGQSGKSFGLEHDTFPYGTENPAKGDLSAIKRDSDNYKILRYLRENGQYLVPGGGIDMMSGIAVVLRGTLLNLLVWLPIITGIMIVMLMLPGLWRTPLTQLGFHPDPHTTWSLFPLLELGGLASIMLCVGALFFLAIASLHFRFRLTDEQVAANRQMLQSTKLRTITLWSIGITVPIICFMLMAAMLAKSLFVGFLWAALAFLVVFVLACVIYSVCTWFISEWYQGRRFFETTVKLLLWASVTLALIGSLQPVTIGLFNWIAGLGGPAAIFAGAASGLWAFIQSPGKQEGGVRFKITAVVGAALLIYGVLLTAFMAAAWTYCSISFSRWDLLRDALDAIGSDQSGAFYFCSGVFKAHRATWTYNITSDWHWIAVIVSIGIALVTGWFVNINHISVHRYYRDRLMEAFMPDLNRIRTGKTGPAKDVDKKKLHEFWNGVEAHGPLHIINTNVVLVESANRVRKIRGGDNFILSPVYSGSNATGWMDSKSFSKTGMTLATAMGISGAAANPNAGVGGKGLTRNRLVSILMALLNLRLGYWVRNPAKKKPIRIRPNHFFPGLYEPYPHGYNENNDWIQLSDGGHFENLGLYELIRRQVSVILCCDGGADPDFSFSDLMTAINRAEQDFGARIEFGTPPAALSDLISKSDPSKPWGIDFADQGHAVGSIQYSDGQTGHLILIKTTLVADISANLLGYKQANPDFPDESTADQFFDEDQFEAYRELGYTLAVQALDDTVVKGLI